MNRYAVGFRWVVILGVLVNMFMALPGIFYPNAVLEFVGEEPVYPQVWVGFACQLLALLSLLYLPGAINLFRHTATAWLSVFSRFTGVWFFLIYHRNNPVFNYALGGWIDLALGLPALILLVLALRRGPDPDY